MQINIYKDRMQKAYLFGTPVLYSNQPIPREDVPQGWYCYDLRGTAEDPHRPYKLVDQAEKNYVGSVLSYLPLKKEHAQSRLVKDEFQMDAVSISLNKFCSDEKISRPEVPLRHMLKPASPDEAGFFYALPPEENEKLGAIGHVRIDFGSSGKGFYHTWWPRGPEELNTQEFRDELDKVVNDLRKSVLKDLSSMRRYCYGYGSNGAFGVPAGAQQSGSGGERKKERSGVEFSPTGGNAMSGVSSDEGGTCCQNYGFTLETERYLYRLRCNPIKGDYQAYLSCFDKQAQQMGLTEKGRQALQDAADSTLPHSYDWYVIEHINTPERQVTHQLPLEEAIALYAGLDCEDKRLGVTKDGIAAVDLAIHWDGREWLSVDRLKLDSFKADPVVAEAAARLQQVLDESPAVGRVTFASGEQWNFTDSEKYLQAIREELPFQATTGFRCETLTDDPTVRKAVDDMLCGLYGEENPRALEDYGNTGMTMGGMG